MKIEFRAQTQDKRTSVGTTDIRKTEKGIGGRFLSDSKSERNFTIEMGLLIAPSILSQQQPISPIAWNVCAIFNSDSYTLKISEQVLTKDFVSSNYFSSLFYFFIKKNIE